MQDKSKKCEESIKTTLSEVKFSELKNKILEDLNKQHVKKYIRGHRELFIDKIEGRLPDGAADLGLLIQIFDRERVIERAFISTLIFLKHDFTDKYYSSFLKSKIEKNNITDEDILNFYKDQRTRTGLSDGYLRQYIKTLLETNFIHL